MRRILTCVLLGALSVEAHDLYLMPEKFQVRVGAILRIAFRNGDSFPSSEVAPKVARLSKAQVAGKGGTAEIERLRETGKETVGEAKISSQGSLLISVQTVPNFIELEASKFESYLKEEGLTDVLEYRVQHRETHKPGRERYSKYAKSIVTAGKPDDYFRHIVGFPIEIVPLSDAAAVLPGANLPVLVLFRGKPVAGLALEVAWTADGRSETNVIGKTGQDGQIQVPISRAGIYRLHSLKMERCPNPKAADWESFWASFTFAVN